MKSFDIFETIELVGLGLKFEFVQIYTVLS